MALRGIEYAECVRPWRSYGLCSVFLLRCPQIQPVYLPRPDLEALGIEYRRIPLLSIGRDVYCDTRLILEKLEDLFPDVPRLSASNPEQLALESLLESWTIDGGVFTRAGQTLSPDMPLLNDPKFIKDREDYSGRSWDLEARRLFRPEGLAHMQQAFDFLENGLLSDGRTWILGSEKPTLADIHAVWPFSWVLATKVSLPPEVVSPKSHPKVHAYVARFNAAISAANSRKGKPTRLSSKDAIAFVTQADFSEAEGSMKVDPADPMAEQLKQGQKVASWPVDSGTLHRDIGKLVKLDRQELVLEVEAKEGRSGVRIHHPRWNFRARPVDGAKL